jgi:bifunctional enzyme CysN/CysC
LGISQFVVAVNKMDLVGYKQRVFRDIASQIDELVTESVELEVITIPVSGLSGDNVVVASKKTTWWDGPTVVQAFEALSPIDRSDDDTRLSIQYVQRIAGGGRRYLASVHSGQLSNGDSLASARYPNKRLVAESLVSSGAFQPVVFAPAEVSFELDVDLDLERGDVLSRTGDIPHTDQFEADVVWLDDSGGLPGRNYLLRLAHQSVKATMTRVFTIDSEGEKLGQSDHVEVNQTVRANLETHEKISLLPFGDAPELGRFILVDSDSGGTVGVGIVNHTLRRADNLISHTFDVSVEERQQLTGRSGIVSWFTGLSGSGKSTLVNEVSKKLTAQGIAHAVLDGDSLRLGLNKDLGFTEADRVENIRRAAEVAKLMADSGLVVLVSLISPYRADRARAAEIVGEHRFHEIFVSTPLEMCEQRDPKGLYKKARQGLIPNFTGIGSPYEAPSSPDYVTDCQLSPASEASRLMEELRLDVES